MEEEWKRRNERPKERGRLSPEERKRRTQEYFERKADEYLSLSPEILLAEAQVHITLYSILAGIMFTASVLFFSLGRELLHGNIFAILTLTDTALFVIAALGVNIHSTYLRHKEMYDAYGHFVISNTFGYLGIFLMLANLVILAFFLTVELGIIMFIIVALCCLYAIYRALQRHLSFQSEMG